MKNKNPSKNESKKETLIESKNTTKKNTTFFNKNFFPKKEESKFGKDLNKFPKDIRAKTSRPKNPYKLSYSRNFNDYKQIFTEFADINQSKINWAIKLRKEKIMNVLEKGKIEENKNKIRNIASAKPGTRGLILTSNFIEPKFYMDDLEKYKQKNTNKRPLSSILNPNFNNVKHLFTNKLNHESKDFAASLRNYHTAKNKDTKIKWNNFYSSKNNCNVNYTKFLLPKTEEGKRNFKKMEEKMYSPYHIIFKDIVFGSDTIKQKVLVPNKDFCYSGVGKYLDFGKYRTNYGVKNWVQNENIIKTETNSQCMFELGLRNYPKNNIKS